MDEKRNEYVRSYIEMEKDEDLLLIADEGIEDYSKLLAAIEN